MGIGESLAGIYSKAEDSFYNLADWLDEKGIPVYSILTPLEENGIPAFPLTIAIIVILIALLLWLFVLPPGITTVKLTIVDDSGLALSGVNVKIVNKESAKELFSGKKANNETVELPSVAAGTMLSVTGSKDGFDAGFFQGQVRGPIVEANLKLVKQVQAILAKFRLVDSKTGTPIPNAKVTLTWGNTVRPGQTDQNGFFEQLSVPAGTDIQVDIVADNYEPFTQIRKFDVDSVPNIPLEPKSTAAFGNASLIIKTFDKATQNPLSDVLVEVTNPQTGQGLTIARTVEGQLVVDLPKGTIYKILATKAGYMAFSSGEQTIRENPTEAKIELEQGGNKLHVTVKDDANVVVANASVRLYSEQGEFITEKVTPFGGTADFLDLHPDQNYFVTASKEGFVPQTVFVSPFSTSEITLQIQAANASNTGTLNILVTDSTGFPGNNTGLDFFELVAGKPIPIGLPTKTTASDGFATLDVPAKRIIFVRARKGLEQGDGNLLIEAGTENNLGIKMKPLATAKVLRVLDMDGNPFVKGKAHVESVTGEILFDANLSEEGTALFDAKTYKAVNVTITDADGNSFSQQVNVENKKEIVVQWPPLNSTELAPPIEFLGIEDSEGKPVQGITPNTDYWLKFSVSWVKGEYRGGVHVRVGNDQTKFADSEEAGIMGFDAASVASFFYSRSYSAFPAPGNEAADLGNAGKAGIFNKWLELYFNNPTGSQVFRVKVRLKEGFSQIAIPIHFRAWTNVNGKFFRTPEDAELGTASFSATKTSLYSKTFDKDVSLFADKEQCEKNVCAEYRFLSEDGETFSKEEFKALRGKKYALEISLRAKEKTGLLVRASTDKKSPKLFFTGSEVETFTEFKDSTEPAPFIEINDLSVLPNSLRTSRIYFKPLKAGNASIKAEIVGENLSLNQDFYFNIFEQSEMKITIEPQPVLLGQSFTVVLQDQNRNEPVTNATIHIKDDQESIVASLVGNNSPGNGANGRYSFSDSIGAGNYKVQATAFGFAPAETELVISANNVLKLPEEIIVSIPKNQRSAQATASIENVSNLTLTDVTIEVSKPENWPSELDVIPGGPSVMRPHQKASLDIAANYSGDQNQRVSGTAEIIAHAVVSGKYPAVATSRLTASYNQPLDAGCLEFDQTALTVFLAANSPLGANEAVSTLYGRTQRAPPYPPLSPAQYTAQSDQLNAPYSPQFANNGDQQYYTTNSPRNIFSNVYTTYDQTAKEIELQATNKCGQALQVTGKAIPKGGSGDNGLVIEVMPFAIQPNETVPTTIRISNKLERALPQQETKDYELAFQAEVLSKSIPLKVVLWDSRFALAVRDSIVLFLSQSRKGEPVITSTPLFMRNIGAEDIKNLEIEIGDSYLEGVSIRTIPMGNIPLLAKGQVVYPPKVVVAEKKGGTEKGRLVHSYLGISGEIDGKRYLLRTVDVWVHVSSLNCLFLTPVDDLEFISPTQLIIDKKVRIRNTCEEPVRVVGIEPSQLGAAELFVLPLATDFLDRDREAEFIIRLSRRGDYKNDNIGISVAGLTQLTHKFISSNRLQSRMELGEKVASTGLASEPFTVNVCKETGVSEAEKESVRFPKISKNADCSKGYCDSMQAAEFLSKKLDDKINQAQNVIKQGNGQLENFIGCVNTAEQKACTFTELGVPSESFDLYLQNDQLTAELLQKQFKEKGPATVANYQVNYCPGPECEIKSIAQTGFPNFLYISNLLRGCGKYHIQLNGAAYAQQNMIRNEAFILAVNVRSRELTPECTNVVDNVMNFLPIDSGLTVESPFGAWPGVIEAEPKLQDVGKAFAKELFGTEEGRVVEGSGSNNIKIQFGDVPNGLVKIELAPDTTTDAPKTIIATINQALQTEGSNKTDLAKEAAQTMAALKKQRIQEGKGCIAKDHSYFILGSATKLGELVLGGPETVNVLPRQLSCIDLNISSPIREGVQLKTNKEELFQTNSGIARIVFKNPSKYDAEIKEEETIPLQFVEKNKKYETAVGLCIEGNEQFVFAKNAKPLDITAQSAIDSLRQSNTKKIRYQICGIHPSDLVKKLFTLSVGDHYATVGWKGPDKTTLGEAIDAAAKAGALEKNGPLLIAPNSDMSKQKSGEQLLKDKRIAALTGAYIPGAGGYWTPKAYLWVCSLTSAICNGVRTAGLFGWAWGPVLDCVLPWAWMQAPDIGLGKAKEYISQRMGTVSSFIVDKVGKLFPGNMPDNDKAVATMGITASSIVQGLKYNNYFKLREISAVSNKIANDIADQVIEQQLKGAGFFKRRELKNMIVEELKPNVQEAISAKAGGSKLLILGGKGKASTEMLQKATEEAVAKTNLDSKVLDFAIKNSDKLKSGASIAGKASELDDLAAKKMAEDFANIKIEGVAGKYGDLLTGIDFDKVAVKDPAGALQLDQTKDLMWDKFMDKVRDNKGWGKLTPQAQDEIRNAIKGEFERTLHGLPTGPGLTEHALRDSFEESVSKSTTALGNLDLTVTTNARKVAKSMAETIEAKSGKVLGGDKDAVIRQIQNALEGGKSPEGAIKQGIAAAKPEVKEGLRQGFKSEVKDVTSKMLSGLSSEKGIGFFKRFRNFFTSFARGLVCGGLSNWAGLWAAHSTLEEPAQTGINTNEIRGTPKIGRDGQPERDTTGNLKRNTELQNGATYKISITESKNPDGSIRRLTEFQKVNDPNSIPKNADFLNTDCTGEFAQRELEANLSLPPSKPATPAVKTEQTSFELTKQTILDAAKQAHIPPALLVTALSLEQKYDFPQASDPNHSWLTNPSGSEEAIQRAATRLQYRGSNEKELRETFTEYFGASDKLPSGYLDYALKTYQAYAKTI